jgi:hypothetical protein
MQINVRGIGTGVTRIFGIDNWILYKQVVTSTAVNVNINQYRYGYGAQEKDNEIYGNGNAYTAEFWEYDSRLGRRRDTDPVVYAQQSPYATFNNNPIYFTDPSGQEGQGGGDPPAGKKIDPLGLVAKAKQQWAFEAVGNQYDFIVDKGSSLKKGTEGIFAYRNAPHFSVLDNPGLQMIGSPQAEMGVGYLEFIGLAKEEHVVQNLYDQGLRRANNGVIYQLPKTKKGNFANIKNKSYSTKISGKPEWIAFNKWYGNAPSNSASKTFRIMGRTAGRLGYVVAAVSTYYDYNDATNGDITWERFSYRLAGSTGSIIAGAAIGSEFGPGYGTLAGVTVADSFTSGEMLYDLTDWWGGKASELNSKWENSFRSGTWWYGPAK